MRHAQAKITNCLRQQYSRQAKITNCPRQQCKLSKTEMLKSTENLGHVERLCHVERHHQFTPVLDCDCKSCNSIYCANEVNPESKNHLPFAAVNGEGNKLECNCSSCRHTVLESYKITLSAVKAISYSKLSVPRSRPKLLRSQPPSGRIV